MALRPALGGPFRPPVFDLGLPDSHPGAIGVQEGLSVPVYDTTWGDKVTTHHPPGVRARGSNL